jgi:hypothetical protein
MKRWRRKPTYRKALASVRKRADGRKALGIFRAFTGVKEPPTVKLFGRGRMRMLVGLGKCPAVTIADGPKGKFSKKRRISLKGAMLASNASGSRLFIIRDMKRGLDFSGPKRKVGYAAGVEYKMSPDLIKAGSSKGDEHYTHEMGEEGGYYPMVKMDPRGNLHFGPASYAVRREKRNSSSKKRRAWIFN